MREQLPAGRRPGARLDAVDAEGLRRPLRAVGGDVIGPAAQLGHALGLRQAALARAQRTFRVAALGDLVVQLAVELLRVRIGRREDLHQLTVALAERKALTDGQVDTARHGGHRQAIEHRHEAHRETELARVQQELQHDGEQCGYREQREGPRHGRQGPDRTGDHARDHEGDEDLVRQRVLGEQEQPGCAPQQTRYRGTAEETVAPKAHLLQRRHRTRERARLMQTQRTHAQHAGEPGEQARPPDHGPKDEDQDPGVEDGDELREQRVIVQEPHLLAQEVFVACRASGALSGCLRQRQVFLCGIA